MSFVNEFSEPFEFPTVTRIWSALGTVQIIKGRQDSSFLGFETEGINQEEALGSLGLGDTSAFILEPGLGALDFGLGFAPGETLTGIDTEGDFHKDSKASLGVFVSEPPPHVA